MRQDGVGWRRREVVLVDQPLLRGRHVLLLRMSAITLSMMSMAFQQRPDRCCSRASARARRYRDAAGDDLLAVPDILLEDALEREQLGRPSTSAIMMTLNDSRSWVNL